MGAVEKKGEKNKQEYSNGVDTGVKDTDVATLFSLRRVFLYL